jgi:hypothetical protein
VSGLENLMFKYYLLTIGTVQTVIALMGFFSPYRTFLMWKTWVLNKFFPMHGIALIFAGLPLTVYKGYLSSLIFVIGLIVVFTGPFIIIYPEKFQKIFENSDEIFNQKEIKTMIFLDAFLRSGAAIIFFISCWKTFFN